jgi:hypothetical protein
MRRRRNPSPPYLAPNLRDPPISSRGIRETMTAIYLVRPEGRIDRICADSVSPSSLHICDIFLLFRYRKQLLRWMQQASFAQQFCGIYIGRGEAAKCLSSKMLSHTIGKHTEQCTGEMSWDSTPWANLPRFSLPGARFPSLAPHNVSTDFSLSFMVQVFHESPLEPNVADDVLPESPLEHRRRP